MQLSFQLNLHLIFRIADRRLEGKSDYSNLVANTKELCGQIDGNLMSEVVVI